MVEKKGGAGPKKSKGPSLSRLYDVKGESFSRKNKFCPKCGHGFFLAKHNDRLVCGKCTYVEMQKK